MVCGEIALSAAAFPLQNIRRQEHRNTNIFPTGLLELSIFRRNEVNIPTPHKMQVIDGL
jgi:hypothetical protein